MRYYSLRPWMVVVVVPLPRRRVLLLLLPRRRVAVRAARRRRRMLTAARAVRMAQGLVQPAAVRVRPARAAMAARKMPRPPQKRTRAAVDRLLVV